MSPTPPPLDFRAVLAIQSFRRLWIAQLISLFGDFLAIYAVYSVVSFQLHGTPTQVSLIMVAFMLPTAIAGPPAGVFVDRWSTKRTMISSDLIRAALAALLLFVTSLWQIYAILFALSVISSFFMPAQTVAVRTLVPKEGLMSSNALIAQAFQIVRILSPAAAGALVAWFGPGSCFLLDTVSFVASASLVSSIAIRRETPAGARLNSVLSDLFSGLRFIFTHPAISFVIIAISAGMFAIGSFGALLAVYVRDVLSSGSMLFGAVSSMLGIGMIAGAQFINRFARKRPKDALVIAGLAGIGLGIGFMALLSTAPTTIIGTLSIGFSVAFVIIPSQTLLQQETPMDMLGRVMSSMMSVISLAQVTALAMAGSVAEAIGIRNLYLISAVMLLVIGVLGFAQLRKRAAVVSA